MVFALTDSLVDQLLFYMEDQQQQWLVDSRSGSIVPAAGRGTGEEGVYYDLPRWTSADGYDLRAAFANNLHAPLAREELKRVLVSGRGVFRNFKNVLKSYPEVERRWHFFKDARMKARVSAWYDALRESWGLERLALEEDRGEETDELVQDDFVFREYDRAQDSGPAARGSAAVAAEYRRQFAGELGAAVACLWQELSSFAGDGEKYGFVCHSQSGEFAGCMLAALCPPGSGKAALLTDFFVLPAFRGLGVGKALCERCLSALKARGIQWVVMTNTIIPESLGAMLEHQGFDRLGSGYMVDLCKE